MARVPGMGSLPFLHPPSCLNRAMDHMWSKFESNLKKNLNFALLSFMTLREKIDHITQIKRTFVMEGVMEVEILREREREEP